MTQVTTLEALAGKTIAKAVALGDMDMNRLGIVFTDGDFLVVSPGSDSVGDSFVYLEHDLYESEAVQLGRMSQEEYDRVIADRKAKADREVEDYQRQQYERLKAKFEGEGDAK